MDGLFGDDSGTGRTSSVDCRTSVNGIGYCRGDDELEQLRRGKMGWGRRWEEAVKEFEMEECKDWGRGSYEDGKKWRETSGQIDELVGCCRVTGQRGNGEFNRLLWRNCGFRASEGAEEMEYTR
ncbi:unnamed protein product [Calypogeia fissa]